MRRPPAKPPYTCQAGAQWAPLRRTGLNNDPSETALLLFGVLIDLLQHGVDAVAGGLGVHGLIERAPVVVQLFDGLDQRIRGHVLLHQHVAQPAGAEGLRVQDLVAAAGRLGIGDQQRGLAGGEDLAQRVGAGAGDDDVGAGVGVGHLLVHVFILHIAGIAVVAGVAVALAAQVQHLEVRGELGQGQPEGLVDGLGPGGAAHHHQHRAAVVEAEPAKARLPAAAQKLRPDRGARVHALALGILNGLL